MAERDRACAEVKRAFEGAGVGTIVLRQTGVSWSTVQAFVNFGYGGQQQAQITVGDDGMCRVYLSRLYDVPAGKSGREMLNGESIPLLFETPISTPDLGETIVRRIRQAIVEG